MNTHTFRYNKKTGRHRKIGVIFGDIRGNCVFIYHAKKINADFTYTWQWITTRCRTMTKRPFAPNCVSGRRVQLSYNAAVQISFLVFILVIIVVTAASLALLGVLPLHAASPEITK